jgi:hypothetical protein
MDQESPLDLTLLRSLGHSQEIEVVGVFEDSLRHIRLWRGQFSLEVGQCLPFPLVQAALDLENQNILTPAVFESGPEVPFSGGPVLDPVQNPQIVAPGQFGNERLQNLRLRPGLGQSAHVPEVPGAEAFDSGELGLQVAR